MSALLKPSGAVSDAMPQQLGQRQAACKAMNTTSARINSNLFFLNSGRFLHLELASSPRQCIALADLHLKFWPRCQ